MQLIVDEGCMICNMSCMRTIPELRQYREGKTLDDAAKTLGVNKTTLLRWEDGSVQIPAERVIEVERVTGISRHELRPDLSSIFISTDAPSKEDAAA